MLPVILPSLEQLSCKLHCVALDAWRTGPTYMKKMMYLAHIAWRWMRESQVRYEQSMLTWCCRWSRPAWRTSPAAPTAWHWTRRCTAPTWTQRTQTLTGWSATIAWSCEPKNFQRLSSVDVCDINMYTKVRYSSVWIRFDTRRLWGR